VQTILGCGGAVGKALAQELASRGVKMRLVSRNPAKQRGGRETVAADLNDAAAVKKAVSGSSVAYLTVGLPYSATAWAVGWPRIMENVINACARQSCRLVFFDNVYMYSRRALERMDESSPIEPSSRKGAVRAGVAQMLMDAVKRGDLEALIARSADFYGPNRPATGALNFLVYSKLAAGAPALWMGDLDQAHSFTYLPDAAHALAVLANEREAFGEVWHLPTAPDPYSGREWIMHIAKALAVRARFRLVTSGMARLAGIFSPLVRESVEMMYQYQQPYVFDSSKIARRYGLQATPAQQQIAEVARDYLR